MVAQKARDALALVRALDADAPGAKAEVAPRDGDASQGQQRCRPNDLAAHVWRLATFRAATWFHKPLELSPIECARRGFVNSGHNEIQCEVCGVKSTYHGQTPGQSPSAWLVECHGAFCP